MLYIAQIIVSVILIVCVLLQAQEGGLSPVFGGGGEMYRSKRNIEKFLVYLTVICAFLLAAFSIALLVLPH